jgi:hypothetical protein
MIDFDPGAALATTKRSDFEILITRYEEKRGLRGKRQQQIERMCQNQCAV